MPIMQAAKPLFSYRKFWAHRFGTAPFLPTSAEEMDALGWDSCDVVIVTGDAYVDHPSFGMAIVGRLLEAQGFRVGVIAQPDWRSADDVHSARPAEPVLRHHRRQHGLDGESLHRRSAHPQRRRVHTGRQGRQPTRSQRDRVCAARARSVQRRADRHRRHRSEPATHRALRLLVGEGAAFGVARCEGRHAAVRQRRTRARGGCASSRGGRTDRGDRRRARYGICARRRARRIGSRSTRRISTHPGPCTPHPDPYAMAPSSPGARPEEVVGAARRKSSAFVRDVPSAKRDVSVIRLPAYDAVRDDPVLYAHASRILHMESNPGNARPLVQRHGDARRVAESAADSADDEGVRRGVRAAVCARAASGLRRREDTRVGNDPVLGRDSARLLRRLHVLFDHRARGSHHPEPLGSVGAARDRDDPRHGRRASPA